MENEIKDLIYKYKGKGYTDAQIKSYLIQRKGFSSEEVAAEFETIEKKNPASSPSSSDLGSVDSQASTSATVAESSALDSDSDDESRVRANRTRETASIVYNRSQAESKASDWYSTRQYDEASGTYYFEDNWGDTPIRFEQEGGAKSMSDERFEDVSTTEQQATEAIIAGKSEEEVIQAAVGHYDDRINEKFAEAMPDVGRPLIKKNEAGFSEFDDVALGHFVLEMDALQLEDERRFQAEMDKLGEMNEVQEIGYDMWTGVLGMARGIQGMYDPENAQYGQYADQFRTQASYKIEGLTDEEIELGLVGNLTEGNMNAFAVMLGTQLAQTTPQLVAQAVITYATGGLGSAAGLSTAATRSLAMWSGSAFMGATTFGNTNAQYYGMVDPEKRIAMALGDAIVETMSERVFTGDMENLVGGNLFKGKSIAQLRKEFFGVGVMSKEFRRMALDYSKVTGKQIAQSGFEEAMEEMVAGIGSSFIHASINGEEFNLHEALDGAIVGFAAGAQSRGARMTRELLTIGVSASGWGGLRSDLIKIRDNKQKLAEQLRNTKSASERALLEAKMKELDKIELHTKAEMAEIYNEYSDEDAEATLKANQKLQDAVHKANKTKDEAEKAKYTQRAQEALTELQNIEAKYGESIAEAKQEKERVMSLDFGDQGSIEVGEDMPDNDSKILKALKNMQTAIGRKVVLHKDLDSYSKAVGETKSEAADSRGQYVAEDGTIHLMLPAIASNTGFHEATHHIARSIDEQYIKRFVDAAMKGMPEHLQAKYASFGAQYDGEGKEGQQLQYEEIFAELNADLALGNITIEGSGGSLAAAAMAPVIRTLKKAGLFSKKNTASFTDFVEYVQGVNKAMNIGQKLDYNSPAKRMRRDILLRGGNLKQQMSPSEMYGRDWNPSETSAFANMTTNENGDFVFLHVSPNKFDKLDPRKVGTNLRTSREESNQINAAQVNGVSMFYTASEDVDVSGQYRYHFVVAADKVYNAVEDPEGLYNAAKNELKSRNIAAPSNTVYAKMTQMANKLGYDVVVMPWKEGALKAQTTKALPVQEAKKDYKSNKSTWEAVGGYSFEPRKAMNEVATELYNKIEKDDSIPMDVRDEVRRLTYSAMDGRFGAPKDFQEFTDRLGSLSTDARFAEAVETANGLMNTNVKSYSIRKTTPEAQAKLKANIKSEFEGGTYGFTFNPVTGEYTKFGTAVADGVNEKRLGDDLAKVAADEAAFDATIQEALKNPKGNVGGWVEDGEFFLDVSEVYDNDETAIRLGLQRNEIGVYNIQEQKYIALDEYRNKTKFKQRSDMSDASYDWLAKNTKKSTQDAIAGLNNDSAFIVLNDLIEKQIQLEEAASKDDATDADFNAAQTGFANIKDVIDEVLSDAENGAAVDMNNGWYMKEEGVDYYVVYSPEGRSWDFASEMSALDFLEENAGMSPAAAAVKDVPTNATDILRANQQLSPQERAEFFGRKWLSDKGIDDAQERGENEQGEFPTRSEIRQERAIAEEYVRRSGVSLERYAQELYNQLETYSKSWSERPMQLELLGQMLESGMFKNTVLIVDEDGSYHDDINVSDAGGVFTTYRDDVIAINAKYDTTMEWMAHIIMHEQMHRFTALAVLDRESSFSKAMVILYNEIKRQADNGYASASIADGMYGMSNVDELIAEAFTNKSFQYQLQYIQVSEEIEQQLKDLGFDTRKTSLWDAFMDLVYAALDKFRNPFKRPSMLDAVISVVDQEVSSRVDKFMTPPRAKGPVRSIVDHKDNPRSLKQKIPNAEAMAALSEVEQMTAIMNAMPEGVINWTAPTMADINLMVDPVAMSEQEVTPEILEKLGYESVDQMTMSIQDLDGIPTMPAMSDVLAAGNVKDALGADMNVQGGIGWGVWGKGLDQGLAWCGVTKMDAQTQVDDAVAMYEANPALFEKLWKDKVLPDGHVPMVIMRMADSAINSNEAVFRYNTTYVQTFPKKNRVAALKAVTDRIAADLEWLEEKQERFEKGMPNMEKGTRAVKDPNKKQSKLTNLEKNQIKAQRRLLDFIKNNDIKTLDQLFEAITENAAERAAAATSKEVDDNPKYLKLTDKEYLSSIIYKPYSTAKRQTAFKGNDVTAALFGDMEGDASNFTMNKILEAIGEKSMMQTPASHTVAVMGVDVKNPAVLATDHGNYGFGPKGRFIAFISDPRHGADVYPEWWVKMARLSKSATQKDENILAQVGSTFFGDKVFRGAAPRMNPTVVEQLSAKLRHAFPFVSVKATPDFAAIIKNDGALVKHNNRGDVIYGIAKDNRIYLNPTESTLATPIYKFAHVWIEFLRNEDSGKKGDALLEKGMELAMETELYARIRPNFKTNEEAATEVLAELIASKGAKAVEASLASRFQNWMFGLFEFVKQHFGTRMFTGSTKDGDKMTAKQAKEFIANMTISDFVNLSLAELLQGQQIKSGYKPAKKESSVRAYSQTKFKQAGYYREVGAMAAAGMKKSEIIAQLIDDGFSEKDANLIYAKGVGYRIGENAGWRAGVKARNEEFAKQRKERLQNEREEAKALRKRMKELYKQEKRVTQAMVQEVADYVKGLKGVSIKTAQLKSILRMMEVATRKVHGNGAKRAQNYAVFMNFVDAVAQIVDKQVEAKQLEDHAKLLRVVNGAQKKLAGRIKNMTKTSRSPLASYLRQIQNLTSVEAGLLSYESLQQLAVALAELQNTTKAVGVKFNEEGAMLNKPYIFIEAIGEYVDTRKAKIYFDEIAADVNNEATQRREQMLVEQAMDIAFEDGTDWMTAYEELVRQRNMKPIEKKLAAIAEEMGMDLDNVQDLEAVMELWAEQQDDKRRETRETIIGEAILPTLENWMDLMSSNADFIAIFGIDPSLPIETQLDMAQERIERLTLGELKRLEFAMFDFIANGSTFGLNALSAIAEAKNDGNNRLRELNMVGGLASGAGSKVREGYFGLFENTPTFFRRIFKRYSQAKVAQFMNAIGFGGMRNNVARAEVKANKFSEIVLRILKNKGLDNQLAQTRMQIYSVLTQKPEGMSDAAWVLHLRNSMELALESDQRLSDAQKEQIEDAMKVFYKNGAPQNLADIVAELESDDNLMSAVGLIRDMFKTQEPRLKGYAESFLGMQFTEEDNYLPMNFRNVGSTANNVEELVAKVDNVGQAFRGHVATKAQAVAGAVYERNPAALTSKKRYIDLNLYSAMQKTYKENEIKIMTARDVAKVSAMTSENNKDFVKSVPEFEARAAIRKKVYSFLVGASDFNSADEILGKRGAKFTNYMQSLTVVSFFGASIEQVLKQSSALMNALVETRSMSARFEYIIHLIQSLIPNKALQKIDSEGLNEWNNKKELMEQFGIAQRDVVTENLGVGLEDGKKIGEKSRFEKGVELSTAALRNTDRVAAQATWIAYYSDYLMKEEGREYIDWEVENANPSEDAAAYADQMTIKDQNLNTRRDKSKLNEMTKGTVFNMVKMIAMPFANFLLNKKMNLAIDFQKLMMGDGANRREGALSLAGTVAEVAAFQMATWMVLAPMYKSLASALFGADDDDESWWDKRFGKEMVKRGFILDMNPFVIPVGMVENLSLRLMNMGEYMLTEDSNDYQYADEEWMAGFERWERLEGMPIFKGTGRGDLNVGGVLGTLGVTGGVANEMRLSAQNLITLNEDQPYYTNRNGQKRYVSREDAKHLAMIELMRTTLHATMAVTGLNSKELSKVLKAGKKPAEMRSTADKEQWIAKELINNPDVGVDDLIGYLGTEAEGDPLNVTNRLDSVIKKAKGSMVDELVSGANINTLRTIDKTESSNRGRAVMIHQIAQTMSEEEAKQFYIDSYIYFGVKYGVETVKNQVINETLKYGDE